MRQGFKITSKVRAKQFKRQIWACLSCGCNALLVVVGSTVWQIVSVDDSDDRMAEVHRGDGLGKVLRFFGVQWWRSCDGADGAKPASTRALLTGDHERSIAACPTLVDVRATRFFANGVQLVVFDRCFCVVEGDLLFSTWQAGAEPIR